MAYHKNLTWIIDGCLKSRRFLTPCGQYHNRHTVTHECNYYFYYYYTYYCYYYYYYYYYSYYYYDYYYYTYYCYYYYYYYCRATIIANS